LPGTGSLIDRYCRVSIALCDSHREARCGVSRGDRRLSREDAGHIACRRARPSPSSTSRASRGARYNWYKGQYTSVIQVNTDLPITIDRCDRPRLPRGLPGHHVYNALLEKHLVRDRGWVEFSVYPLFSPSR
jgi:hypothetical protein